MSNWQQLGMGARCPGSRGGCGE